MLWRRVCRTTTEHPHRRERLERARDGVESAVLDLDDALQARTGVRLSWWDDGVVGDEPVVRPRPDGYRVTVHVQPRAGRQKKLHRALVAELAAHGGEPAGELRSRDGYELLTELLHVLTSDLVERLDHGVEMELVAGVDAPVGSAVVALQCAAVTAHGLGDLQLRDEVLNRLDADPVGCGFAWSVRDCIREISSSAPGAAP